MSLTFSDNNVDTFAQEQVHARKPVGQHIQAPLSYLRDQSSVVDEADDHMTNNHQRFSHLLAIMPASVLVIDQKGCVSLANQQAISLLGEPLIGEAWRNVIARVFAPQDDDGHEVSMTNGKKVKIDISPLTQEKGQLIVITDLTQTRELQSRVGHMQRLSSLGKMVASLAHQVRTPLSSAMLYAENLKSMRLQDNMASRFCEKLSLRLKELESQVNDMLLFAKSSDNQIVSVLPTMDILQQCAAQTEAQLQQANISFNVKFHEDEEEKAQKTNSAAQDKSQRVGDQFILGNLTALTGAITNLITNAMQALEHQRIETENSSGTLQSKRIHTPQIELSVKQTIVNNHTYCVFTVTDNGHGLAQDDIARLFEPFYTTKSQGTGLGLAVVSTVAKSHKGFAKCGNNALSGAFFSLYIPTHNEHTQNLSSELRNSIDNLPNSANITNLVGSNTTHNRSAS